MHGGVKRKRHEGTRSTHVGDVPDGGAQVGEEVEGSTIHLTRAFLREKNVANQVADLDERQRDQQRSLLRMVSPGLNWSGLESRGGVQCAS